MTHEVVRGLPVLGQPVPAALGVLVCVEHPVSAVVTVAELAAMPSGTEARRANPGELWRLPQHTHDERLATHPQPGRRVVQPQRLQDLETSGEIRRLGDRDPSRAAGRDQCTEERDHDAGEGHEPVTVIASRRCSRCC
ncbi:hypothetical protein [Micromonospora chersina]|uniref:hypothetical protein n=1 Tax=Micromonospora chersina TaxID=47854 RepID=UPI00371B5CF9